MIKIATLIALASGYVLGTGVTIAWEWGRMSKSIDNNDIARFPSTETVRGEWMNVGVLTVRCSNCKSEFHELEAMNFCPNCGAKMKGGDSK